MTIVAPEQPAGHDARRRIAVLRPQHLGAAAATWSRTGALNLDFEDEVAGDRSSPTAARSSSEAVEKLLAARRRRRHEPAKSRLPPHLTIFVLAILCGFAVISKVPATLHTPLMSGANSIHGIVLVGAMFIAVAADDTCSARSCQLRRRRVRDDERRRRLRRHRPDAPDVQAQARRHRRPSRRERLGRWTDCVDSRALVRIAWLVGAAAFVLGLIRMNSPATARNGNLRLGGRHGARHRRDGGPPARPADVTRPAPRLGRSSSSASPSAAGSACTPRAP